MTIFCAQNLRNFRANIFFMNFCPSYAQEAQWVLRVFAQFFLRNLSKRGSIAQNMHKLVIYEIEYFLHIKNSILQPDAVWHTANIDVHDLWINYMHSTKSSQHSKYQSLTPHKDSDIYKNYASVFNF